jgi:hypothetical protein
MFHQFLRGLDGVERTTRTHFEKAVLCPSRDTVQLKKKPFTNTKRLPPFSTPHGNDWNCVLATKAAYYMWW